MFAATYLELLRARHHSLEAHAYTLDDCEQHRTAYRAISDLLRATADGERPSREEARDDGVPRILLLADALNRAVESAEKATPHPEVPAENWRAHLDRCDGAYPSLAVGAVPEALNTVPYCAADSLGRDGKCQLSVIS